MVYSRYDRVVNLKPSFPIPQHPQEALTFSQKIAYLLSDVHHSLPGATAILKSLNDDLHKILHLAFDQEDPQALLDVHKALYSIYEISFSHPFSTICLHQNSPWLLAIRNELETTWLSYELLRIEKCLPAELEATNSHSLCYWLVEQAHKKSNTDSCVLKFLRDEASVEQFNLFFLADAPLNYRFFDTLSLALIYFSETVKSEIASNMWDECGHGVAEKSHTHQFTSMLTKLGLKLPPFPIWEDWRPYSGYNSHFCFGLNRRYYFRGIGGLAMPELFDPVRNRSVVIGLERLYPDARMSCEYFYNHIEVDEKHGSHWLNHIIFPIVEAQPETGMELAIGAALRMEAMRRYNQYLASKFGLLD